MTRTAERLAVVNMALMNEDEAVSREMIERFAGCAQRYLVIISVLILCRILIDNVLKLSKMSKRATLGAASLRSCGTAGRAAAATAADGAVTAAEAEKGC